MHHASALACWPCTMLKPGMLPMRLLRPLVAWAGQLCRQPAAASRARSCHSAFFTPLCCSRASLPLAGQLHRQLAAALGPHSCHGPACLCAGSRGEPGRPGQLPRLPRARVQVRNLRVNKTCRACSPHLCACMLRQHMCPARPSSCAMPALCTGWALFFLWAAPGWLALPPEFAATSIGS